MRRLLVLCVAVATVFALALPAIAADNPAIGTWENDDIDGSHQTMTINERRDTVVFRYVDDGATFCEDLGLGFVPLTFSGHVLRFESDPLIFGVIGDVYCHPVVGGRQLVFEDGFLVFEYVAESDTLVGLGDGRCWYRAGNPASCAAG